MILYYESDQEDIIRRSSRHTVPNRLHWAQMGYNGTLVGLKTHSDGVHGHTP